MNANDTLGSAGKASRTAPHPVRVTHLCSYLHVAAFEARGFEALQRRRVRQQVVTPHDSTQQAVTLNPDIPLFDSKQKQWGVRHKFIYSLKVKAYEAFLRRYPSLRCTDVVHAHSLYADGLTGDRFARQHALPLIITIRDGDVALFPRYYPHWHRQVRATLRSAAAVIFVNHRYRARLEHALSIRLDDAKCHVIPNGVESRWLDLAYASKNHSKLRTRIICTGKLIPRKNQDLLIDAVAKVRAEKRVDVTLDLIGAADGDYARSVLTRCQNVPWLHYLGTRNQEELASLYHDYDMLALASHSENFGLVYAEALLAGLPVLYSRGHGFDGWGDGDETYGVAVDSRDVVSIAAGLRTIMENPNGYSAGTAMARRLFDWSSIAEQLETIYRDASS